VGAHTTEQASHLVVRLQILQHAVWRDDEVEGRAKIELRDVTQLHGDLCSKRGCLPELRATDLEHRFGQLDPVDEPAVFGQGEGYPTGTATELENTGVGVRNARNIERQIVQWLAIEVIEPCDCSSRIFHGALATTPR
jgi:hypothetical protein